MRKVALAKLMSDDGQSSRRLVRKSAALARASSSLRSLAANTTQVTVEPGYSLSSLRIVPPHPISISSLSAQTQDAKRLTRRPAKGDWQHQKPRLDVASVAGCRPRKRGLLTKKHTDAVHQGQARPAAQRAVCSEPRIGFGAGSRPRGMAASTRPALGGLWFRRWLLRWSSTRS